MGVGALPVVTATIINVIPNLKKNNLTLKICMILLRVKVINLRMFDNKLSTFKIVNLHSETYQMEMGGGRGAIVMIADN